MNQRQLNQLARYTPVILNFDKPKGVVGGMEIHCKSCNEKSTVKNYQLSYALKVGNQIVCKFCDVKIPAGFKHHGDGLLQCKTCDKEYHRENETKYFACYCMLEKKQNEKLLFETLSHDEFDDPRVISRAESLLDMNHNVDIKLTLDNGIILYIEVVNGSHNSQTKLQDEYFEMNCLEDTFLFYVHEGLITDEYQLEKFADYIEHLTFDELDNQPIHYFGKDHFEEEEEYCLEMDGWY